MTDARQPGTGHSTQGVQNAGDTRRADDAADLRAELVAKLRERGKITSPAVERAFRTVGRERFLPPDVDLDTAYHVDKAVVTKHDEHGEAISLVSAAYIQARMLEQAELRPGMTVLEIGSGGLNAAYLAEIVGEDGRVISVDIDPDVTDRAATLLDANGYSSRVRVLLADAEQGVPGEGPFDAIIMTVGARDIAPAWLRQLAPGGALVAPLIMNGETRTIGFRRDGDHLVSTSIEVAGFVPMQGRGRRDERVFELTGLDSKKVTLRFDAGAPLDPGQLDGVFTTEPVVMWSGVFFPNETSWADLYLWFAWYLPGFCRLTAEDNSELDKHEKWFPFGAVHGCGLAYLVVPSAWDGGGVQFGARAYGPDGEQSAAALIGQIRAWDRDSLRAEPPVFGYWPTGSNQSSIPHGAAVMPKKHGVVTLSWPSKT